MARYATPPPRTALTHGVQWPRDAHHFIDFLVSYLAERPSPSFPRALLVAVSWMEARAAIEVPARLSYHDGVRRTVERLTQELEEGGDEKHRAPRLPVVALVGLENLVMDESAPMVLRVVAWSPSLNSGMLQVSSHSQTRWNSLTRAL